MKNHDRGSRVLKNQSLIKAASACALFATSLLFNQACGGFSSATNSALSEASVAPPFAIVSADGLSGTGQTLTFTYSGLTLPAGTAIQWSHIFADSTGAPLPACTELNGETSMAYQLNCSQAGILTLALDISGTDGAADGAAEFVYSVGGATTTPVATPPPPTGPNAAGAALFATDCASCHGGSLASNNIGGVQVSAIQSAIQTQPSMASLSSLSATQLQQISDALNGK